MDIVFDWEPYRNFSKAEFDCKHTGKNKMRIPFMTNLQDLRTAYGKPMIITSGYRSTTHPVEKKKERVGEHTFGLACDVAVFGADALRLVEMAPRFGFQRIGVKQGGPPSGRFIHLGMANDNLGFPSPMIWSY